MSFRCECGREFETERGLISHRNLCTMDEERKQLIRQRRSDAQKKVWSDNKYRERQREAHKGIWTCKNHPMLGKHHTEETKQKMSKHWNYEKHFTQEIREKLSEAGKGRFLSEKTRGKIAETHKGKKHTEATKKQISEKKKKYYQERPDVKEEIRKTITKKWKDPEYIQMMITARNTKPNKSEQYLNTIIQKHFPKEYVFNGDFSAGITLGGLIPDWVNCNGKKKVIELFGEPFHDEKKAIRKINWKGTEFGRKAVFSQLGFDTLIIWWEYLRRNSDEEVVALLKEFNER